MTLDTFERYKHNFYLSPITADTLEKLGTRCGLTQDSNVLDVSCGKGGAAITFAEKFRCVVTGVEPRPDFAEDARRRAMFEDLDLFVNIIDDDPANLPFDDHYFDMAMMLGTVHPFDTGNTVLELSRVVRHGGWIALSEMVWKPGATGRTTASVQEWLEGFSPNEISDVEARKDQFQEAGFQVELVEMEADTSWESFYAPQAQVLLENKRENAGSATDQTILDQWQNELQIFHSGGGKDSFGYVCYLLRRP